MKTLKTTPIVLFLMVMTAFALSACGKSSNNNTTANQACSTTSNSYGGASYGNSSYYGGGYNGGYNGYGGAYSGGQLYITGTSTPATLAQCATVNGVATTGATTYGVGGAGGNCSGGIYYSPQYQQRGQCVPVSQYQSSCAGMTLISLNPQNYGQQVVCQ